LKSLIEVTSEELDQSTRSRILQLVQENHFVIIRGLVSRDEVREKLFEIWDYSVATSHLGTSGVPQSTIKTFSSKWSIGGESPIQANLARFMLTIYAPLGSNDGFNIDEWFMKLIQVRDLCAGRPQPLYDSVLEPPFFNGTRLQIYPSGGGFMSSHTDSTAVNTFSAASDGLFLQPLLLVTEQGLDYESGGAFYEDLTGNKVFIEGETQSGDIVVYDESIKHGVADVDSHLPFDLNSRRGRIVALSTIYK
jgi:hypothetical protein